MLAGFLGVPEMLEHSALLAICAILTLGAVATALSCWGPARPLSRLVGLAIGYLVGASQLWASLNGPEREIGALHHIPGNVRMIMLVGIAALPLRPLQTTFLGSSLRVSYWILLPLAGQTIDENFHLTHIGNSGSCDSHQHRFDGGHLSAAPGSLSSSAAGSRCSRAAPKDPIQAPDLRDGSFARPVGHRACA